MNILALETATEALSVAVQHGDRIESRHELAPRKHAELGLVWADELLAQAGLNKADLQAIAISRGPGAFTGVRLAIAMGQGIALALGTPLIGVSTLATLAMGAVRQHRAAQILAVIDARMDEIYAARFSWDGHTLSALDPEQVIAPADLSLQGIDSSWHIVGSGLTAVHSTLAQRASALDATLDSEALPDARDVLSLARIEWAAGRISQPEQVEPAYLRNKVALTIAERQAGQNQ